MKPVRIVQWSLSSCFFVYMLMVGLGNLLAWDINWGFVREVMSMSELPDNALKGRAIMSQTVQVLAYAVIIGIEFLSAFLFFVGSWRMWKLRRSSGKKFRQAGSWSVYGALLVFILFFLVFITAAGEYFQLWLSKSSGALQVAGRNTLISLALLLVFLQKDGDRG
ncbi:MAG: DUF2165 domain-containing protein [Cytophagales bacterium]|nr:DUF2165 domain-containing protein [Cytophagales bacterium]